MDLEELSLHLAWLGEHDPQLRTDLQHAMLCTLVFNSQPKQTPAEIDDFLLAPLFKSAKERAEEVGKADGGIHDDDAMERVLEAWAKGFR